MMSAIPKVVPRWLEACEKTFVNILEGPLLENNQYVKTYYGFLPFHIKTNSLNFSAIPRNMQVVFAFVVKFLNEGTPTFLLLGKSLVIGILTCYPLGFRLMY